MRTIIPHFESSLSIAHSVLLLLYCLGFEPKITYHPPRIPTAKSSWMKPLGTYSGKRRHDRVLYLFPTVSQTTNPPPHLNHPPVASGQTTSTLLLRQDVSNPMSNDTSNVSPSHLGQSCHSPTNSDSPDGIVHPRTLQTAVLSAPECRLCVH